jgi:hypothetical protein
MKNILFLILIPLSVFSQHSTNMKGEKKADAMIIDLLDNYMKAYEYEDFESIASYFDYPTTFKAPIGNTILKDKEELIKFYRVARSAEVVGDDYWYSLYKKIKPIWINKDLCIMDAFYNRYGKKYNLVHEGRALYMFRKTDDGWKIFDVTIVPN